MGSSVSRPNRFGARAQISFGDSAAAIYRLDALASQQTTPIERLPFTLRILLENALRNADLASDLVSEADVLALAHWQPNRLPAPGDPEELPFMPSRVIMRISRASLPSWTSPRCATR